MMKHIILFKIKPGISKQEKEAALANFLALKKALPGIVSLVGGECGFLEKRDSVSFTHAFSIDFENISAFQAFLHDPITHPAKDAIVSIAENGYNGIIGFNLEN